MFATRDDSEKKGDWMARIDNQFKLNMHWNYKKLYKQMFNHKSAEVILVINTGKVYKKKTFHTNWTQIVI